jgi:hypothetical protein
MTGFQTVVNRQPALGIEGDWASSNPRSSLVAFDGALVAGVNILVGRFAWADGDGVVNYGGNGRLGFVQVDQPSLIPFNPAGGFAGIGQATLQVVPGNEMNLQASGDFLCRFAAGAVVNQKVYANFADGTAFAAVTGSPAGATSTTFSIAAATSAFTASIAAGILNVSAVSSGSVVPGTVITGSGSISGNQVIRQLSGTTSGVGLYELAEDDGTVVGSESMTGSYGLLTLGGTVTGTFSLGDPLTAAGSTAGTTIWANSTNSVLTGNGGAGTYAVSPSQAISTGTITAATNVETPWFIETFAAAGELAIISKR